MVECSEVYEATTSENVSETVVRALADAKGVDPMELDVRLYDVIDPDALDALFASDGVSESRRVSFTVGDCRVAVDGSGCVHVSSLDALDPSDRLAPSETAARRDAASCWNPVS